METISAKARKSCTLVEEHPHVRQELSEIAHRKSGSWQIITLFPLSFGSKVHKVIQWIIGVTLDILDAKLIIR